MFNATVDAGILIRRVAIAADRSGWPSQRRGRVRRDAITHVGRSTASRMARRGSRPERAGGADIIRIAFTAMGDVLEEHGDGSSLDHSLEHGQVAHVTDQVPVGASDWFLPENEGQTGATHDGLELVQIHLDSLGIPGLPPRRFIRLEMKVLTKQDVPLTHLREEIDAEQPSPRPTAPTSG